MASNYATPWSWQQGGSQTAPGGDRISTPWRFGQTERTTFSQGAGPVAMAPSLLDPRIYMAGRQAPEGAMGSNRPYGNLWQSASQWISRMPALVGR